MSKNSKVSFFSIGLVRGLIGLLIGMIIGILLVTVIQLILGKPAWDWGPSANSFGFSQAAWVVGALLGGVGFMLGVGVLNDWFKWMKGVETPEHPQDAFPSGWPRYLSVTFDHKAIGIQYGFTIVHHVLNRRSLCAHLPHRAGLAGFAVSTARYLQHHHEPARHRDDLLHPAGRRGNVQLPGAGDDRRQ